MTTDSDRRFADLAMKAANERTHQMIALAASQARIAALEFDISARVAGQRSDHERIAALETAARNILPAAAHGIAEAYVRSQGDTYQSAYDALAALLAEEEA